MKKLFLASFSLFLVFTMMSCNKECLIPDSNSDTLKSSKASATIDDNQCNGSCDSCYHHNNCGNGNCDGSGCGNGHCDGTCDSTCNNYNHNYGGNNGNCNGTGCGNGQGNGSCNGSGNGHCGGGQGCGQHNN